MSKKKIVRYKSSKWEWFENKLNKKHNIAERLYNIEVLKARILVEILKELQDANDRWLKF